MYSDHTPKNCSFGFVTLTPIEQYFPIKSLFTSSPTSSIIPDASKPGVIGNFLGLNKPYCPCKKIKV